MLAYIVIGVTFLLLTVFSVIMILRHIHPPELKSLPDSAATLPSYEPPSTPFIELRELSRLNNWYFFENLRALIEQAQLAEMNSVLHAKFQQLYETHMESYLLRLMEVLGRDNPKLYDIVTKRYDNLALHDMLLIMLMDTNLTNRDMAELLCVPFETQKKRKLRLKAKMEKYGGIPSTKSLEKPLEKLEK